MCQYPDDGMKTGGKQTSTLNHIMVTILAIKLMLMDSFKCRIVERVSSCDFEVDEKGEVSSPSSLEFSAEVSSVHYRHLYGWTGRERHLQRTVRSADLLRPTV